MPPFLILFDEQVLPLGDFSHTTNVEINMLARKDRRIALGIQKTGDIDYSSTCTGVPVLEYFDFHQLFAACFLC